MSVTTGITVEDRELLRRVRNVFAEEYGSKMTMQEVLGAALEVAAGYQDQWKHQVLLSAPKYHPGFPNTAEYHQG